MLKKVKKKTKTTLSMLKTDMEDIKKIKFLGVTKQFPK